MTTFSKVMTFLGFGLFFVLSSQTYAEDTSPAAEPGFDPDPFQTPDFINVSVVNELVDSGWAVSGKADANFQYWVESNANELNFYCLVTDMRQENTGDTSGASLISVDRAYGCQISPINALSVAGENTIVVPFENKKTFLEGRDAVQSDYVTFLTQDGEEFRQTVFVKLRWNRSNEALPVGQYRGAVKLVVEKPDSFRPIK